MECENAREALSSLFDRELAAPPGSELAGHVEVCDGCRDFLGHAREIERLTRAGRPEVPDVTAAVIETIRSDGRRRGYALWTSALRLGLVGVGIVQLALAVPGLVFGTDEGAPIHVAHEVGAWDLALAVAFVYTAWRPLHALGLLPFAAALTVGLLLTAIVDVAHGRAVALTETTHLLELAGTTLLYLLLAPRVPARRTPELRVV